MLLPLYRTIGRAAWPFIRGRLRRSHGEGFDERIGIYDEAKLASIRGAGPSVIWLHAVSVGEVQASAPIVRSARENGYGGAIVLSTVTPTGAKNARDLIGRSMTAHIYAPWDIAFAVRRAVEQVAPSVYASVETEIWPALLSELASRKIPRLLLNARVSDRTWARRRRLGPLLRAGYALFDEILARGEEDARRLAAIGVDSSRLSLAGDTKIDEIVRRRASAEAEAASIASRLAHDRSLFVAGSTHTGEDEPLLEAFAEARAAAPCALAIVPRHPERAGEVLALAQRYGSASLWSSLDRGAPAPEIVVVDTIGVLFSLYGAASAAFVGGSLVPRGGQNILEPASWGVPALHGPHMEDFAEPTAELDATGSAHEVAGARDIASLFIRYMGRRANDAELPQYFAKNIGASARAWRAIERYI